MLRNELDQLFNFFEKDLNYHKMVYKFWNAKDILGHITFWHESFAKNISDLYGMVITEQIEIPLTTLKTLALENGKKVAPDLRIIKEEYRHVNGKKILMLQMHGTMQGIKIAYIGYYYSNSNGTIQLVSFTSQNLVNKFYTEIQTLLNGLVEL